MQLVLYIKQAIQSNIQYIYVYNIKFYIFIIFLRRIIPTYNISYIYVLY